MACRIVCDNDNNSNGLSSINNTSDMNKNSGLGLNSELYNMLHQSNGNKSIKESDSVGYDDSQITSNELGHTYHSQSYYDKINNPGYTTGNYGTIPHSNFTTKVFGYDKNDGFGNPYGTIYYTGNNPLAAKVTDAQNTWKRTGIPADFDKYVAALDAYNATKPKGWWKK